MKSAVLGKTIVGEFSDQTVLATPGIELGDNDTPLLTVSLEDDNSVALLRVPLQQFDAAYRTAQQEYNKTLQAKIAAQKEAQQVK